MAISKTQPMRSAEIELVDAANDLDTRVTANATAIDGLSSALGTEVSDRAFADAQLSTRIDTEATQRLNADDALDARIDTEIENRQSADTALGTRIDNEVEARTNADTAIMNIIGSGFSSSDTIADAMQALQTFSDRYRFGVTQAYTIAPSTYEAVSITLAQPFSATDEVIVLLCPVGSSETFGDIRTTLLTATPYGFTANVDNDDTLNSHGVALGYLMVKVN